MKRTAALVLAATLTGLSLPPVQASDPLVLRTADGLGHIPVQGSALLYPRSGHILVFGVTPNHLTQPAPDVPDAGQWQYQPSPPAPILAPPKFSHPRQGYFPREQLAPQTAPGYEYDYGGTGTDRPPYPMEGASWSEPRTTPLNGG